MTALTGYGTFDVTYHRATKALYDQIPIAYQNGGGNAPAIAAFNDNFKTTYQDAVDLYDRAIVSRWERTPVLDLEQYEEFEKQLDDYWRGISSD